MWHEILLENSGVLCDKRIKTQKERPKHSWVGQIQQRQQRFGSKAAAGEERSCKYETRSAINGLTNAHTN